MIRRPPRSTLFPYTDALPISIPVLCPKPYVRSASCRRSRPRRIAIFTVPTFDERLRMPDVDSCQSSWVSRIVLRPILYLPCSTRSEEHTSELQSRQYLVCRLL